VAARLVKCIFRTMQARFLIGFCASVIWSEVKKNTAYDSCAKQYRVSGASEQKANILRHLLSAYNPVRQLTDKLVLSIYDVASFAYTSGLS